MPAVVVGFDASLQAGDASRGRISSGASGGRSGPFVRAATGVHEDGSAAKGGAGGGHGGIPEVAADVVDDLGAGLDGTTGGGGVEGVDGEDGAGALFDDGLDDWEDAGLLFGWGERGGVGPG